MKTKVKKAKLTLTVNRDVIERAKESLKNQSLSRLVEEYLERWVDEQEPVPAGSSGPGLAASLQGCASSALSRKSDRDIKAQMYRDRHGV